MNVRFVAVAFSFFIFFSTSYATPEALSEHSVVTQQKVNLNDATLATLAGSFKGIGKKRAEAILAYRESHHGFKSLEELAEVKGLGQRFVDKNRQQLERVYTLE